MTVYRNGVKLRMSITGSNIGEVGWDIGNYLRESKEIDAVPELGLSYEEDFVPSSDLTAETLGASYEEDFVPSSDLTATTLEISYAIT